MGEALKRQGRVGECHDGRKVDSRIMEEFVQRQSNEGVSTGNMRGSIRPEHRVLGGEATGCQIEKETPDHGKSSTPDHGFDCILRPIWKY